MPVEISYTDDNGILIKASGKVKAADLLNANKLIYENEDKVRSIKYQLCDLTTVEFTQISSNEVQSIANQDKRASILNPKMITAIAGNQDVIYGLARMWQSYLDSSSGETAVFRTVEEAKSWIRSKLKSKE